MLGFGWTWLIYTFIGSFGATAISSINSRPGTNGATVLDFMQKDDIFTLIVEVKFLFFFIKSLSGLNIIVIN